MYFKEALILAGIIQFGILFAGLTMTKVLNWKTELKKLDALSEHVILTHGAYVWFTILAFAIVSTFFAAELAADTLLALLINIFIAGFWGVRFLIQMFIFDARPYLTSPILTIGYHGLTVSFLYLTVVYLYGAVL